MAFDANNEEGGPIGFFSEMDPAKGQFLDCFNLTKVVFSFIQIRDEISLCDLMLVRVFFHIECRHPRQS
jgi:hypothetical protein